MLFPAWLVISDSSTQRSQPQVASMSSSFYLGIFEGHADPAVAIVSDGEVIAFAEEERFIRQKHAFGIYPINALKFCLRTAGITLSDVASVALNWNLDQYTNGEMQAFYDKVNAEFPVNEATKAWQRNLINRFDRATTEARHHFEWRRAFGDIRFPKIVSAPHHYTHAFQSVSQSGFDSSLCLTIDGSGDQHCTVLWEHRGSSIKPIYERTIPHSLGWVYAAFTEYLGFEAYSGEYKLMGLAAYGRYNDELIDAVGRIVLRDPDDPHSYRVDPNYIHYGPHTYSKRYTDKLVELLGRAPRISTDDYSPWHEDLAFAVQYHLEQCVARLVRWGIEQTGLSRVTVGGGVGLNVKMNSKLFALPEVTDLWANPLCSDGGAAAGAALAAEAMFGGTTPKKLRSLALGNAEEDIESVLAASKVPYERSANIARDVASLLDEGKVVGWFQGRMEAGPRALGQRSILADPRRVSARDKVNAVIKFREYWRPFCPSMLVERADEYLVSHTEAPFMVIAFEATDKLRKEAPAVVHVDGTARVQLVEKDVLPLYHSLITEFEKLTGVGVILNTSFNVKGEPVVCTLRDALRTFWSTGLDVLAAGDFLVSKPVD
ncbi:MAG TPA: carbamoyltransferase C-terminal domain-containing protein [Pyrinomonadaceae bacterium]|nr:carbamoyltransferase C-terminal domain-containing protein [Pyrinomonadaceae bacterium]HMP65232.1 carbamoyltransferase C-terminal domain-containing protein [Pyrinomonadaceae bacterium]